MIEVAKSAAALTDAYSGWVSDWIDVRALKKLVLLFDYIKGMRPLSRSPAR